MLSEVIELIELKQRFAITSHVRPDGDSLGSSLALMLMLESMNKEAVVVMRDLVPRAYQELPGAERVQQVARFEGPMEYDAVFVVECSDIDRPGLPDLTEQFTVNIDHHATTVRFGNINWIDSTASAVGEMIYNLCKAMGVRVTPEIAECVYAALLTDTGSFHFPNTTDRTLKVASELVRLGANPARVSRAIYYSHPFSKLKLMGLALSSLTRDSSGRIACLAITQRMMAEADATEEDAEGIVTYPLSVADIDIVVSLKELGPNVYRASLRSKDSVNVAKVAEYFGGGGHRNAAGCTMQGELKDIEHQLINKLQEALNHRANSIVIRAGEEE
ncbi:MAG: bifunctional oligoribonuclease/PAP phosphatase NrnA [Acidobacteria bacterium]|nr:bifunctional oligoribonuclease/PAP phosphatase NrnA [Acidobacteriota bacterium]